MRMMRDSHFYKIPRVLVVLVHSQVLKLGKLDFERDGVPVDRQRLRLESLLYLIRFLRGVKLDERLWTRIMMEDKDLYHLMNFVAQLLVSTTHIAHVCHVKQTERGLLTATNGH